jgi:hypothetical protein
LGTEAKSTSENLDQNRSGWKNRLVAFVCTANEQIARKPSFILSSFSSVLRLEILRNQSHEQANGRKSFAAVPRREVVKKMQKDGK